MKQVLSKLLIGISREIFFYVALRGDETIFFVVLEDN